VNALFYVGSIVIIFWGIAHLIPTGSIVKGFGEISEDNKKILTIGVVAEGVVLIFTGLFPLLVLVITGSSDRGAHIVYFYSAVLLLVLAVMTALTGARTSIIWYKICPVVKTMVAILFLFGSLL
jgi:ABC-type polysaccharide/polyol phosphate export permease